MHLTTAISHAKGAQVPHDVIMPQMGESIAEGTVTTWLKKVGDTVERDEPLFEIATDKVDAEIPSPVAGVLTEIRVQPGATVPINSVVAVISQPGEAAAPTPAPSAAATPTGSVSGTGTAAQGKPEAPPVPASPSRTGNDAPTLSPQGSGAGGNQKSSPLVRKIAAEHDVNIAGLTGSGMGGRVTKEDILGHLQGAQGDGAGPQTPAPAMAPAVPKSPATQTGAPAPTATSGTQMVNHEAPIPENYRARVFEGDRVEEMATMRSKIAEHMVLSKRVSPHVGTVWEMDFSHVAQLRSRYKKVWAERYGVNLTFTTFIIKATVDALKSFEVVNASLDGRKIIYHHSVNLGLAVALDWGLIVPVIHNADELNTLGLARRAQDLAARARIKKLKPDEVAGGTFTITNPGSFGPMFNLPIINQPQAAILGVGTVEKRPVVIDDMIGIRTRAYTSLSFDHRLIDGAVADQFMARIKQGIEGFEAKELEA
jgi:pyruvate dehydrogenase E2 component (dihydrolipoamide acetyltransferase)